MSNCPMHQPKTVEDAAVLMDSLRLNPVTANCGNCTIWDDVTEKCREEKKLLEVSAD